MLSPSFASSAKRLELLRLQQQRRQLSSLLNSRTHSATFSVIQLHVATTSAHCQASWAPTWGFLQQGGSHPTNNSLVGVVFCLTWLSSPTLPSSVTQQRSSDKGAAVLTARSVGCSLLFPLWATWTHHSSMGRWARGPPHNSKGAAASAESERTCTYTLTVILIRGL